MHTLIRAPGQAPTLAQAVGRDRKGLLSPLIYAVGIPVALVAPPVAFVLYCLVVAIWIIPDLRIERALAG